MKEPDGSLKIEEGLKEQAGPERKVVEQDFGVDDDEETKSKRKQFANVDRVSFPSIAKLKMSQINYLLLTGASKKFGHGTFR